MFGSNRATLKPLGSSPKPASNREPEKKEATLDLVRLDKKLPFFTKRLILSFLGNIGTKKFEYCGAEFKYKDPETQEEKSRNASFLYNFYVLATYIERAELTKTIAINLLWNKSVEQTLVLARQNPKCLPIPVLIQDPYDQWIEATPLQALAAAGDRNPPRCDLYLMSGDTDSYKKSDRMNLYLYNKQGEFFYHTEDRRVTLDDAKALASLKDQAFNQRENPEKCSDLNLCAIVLNVTFELGHTLPPKDAKDYGLVERLSSCFENLAHAQKQLTMWNANALEATRVTMAPYVAAIRTACQRIATCDEITDALTVDEALQLPQVIEIAEDFRNALKPNPDHIVKSGSLFSFAIFLIFIDIFKASVDEHKDEYKNVDEKDRASLGSIWSGKSNCFDAIVYPPLQIRLPRCGISMFRTGPGNIERGINPDRIDYTNGVPKFLDGIGTPDFFGWFGDIYGPGVGVWRAGRAYARFFSNLMSSNSQPQLELCNPSLVSKPGAGAR